MYNFIQTSKHYNKVNVNSGRMPVPRQPVDLFTPVKPDSTLQQPSEGESLTGTSFADYVLS